tara:strand:+ start:294 stop:719 length:426 start_codon:yes stop_codon:yes gene_type:complete
MKLKQLTEWVHQLVTESDYKVIKEIQLGETTVRLSTSTDANFHNNIVQLVSNNGRIALDKKDMRALLNYIKTIMGYSYMPRLKKEGIVMEGKMVKLPSGLKAELDTFKGLTLFTRQGKPIKFDRKELAMFLRSVGKHMGVR